MAIDEVLASRIRSVLSSTGGITEKSMFGGVAWMLNGNMALGITSKGDLMARVGPDAHQWALGQPGARPMDFAGRPMVGMVFVDGTGHATEDDLARWAGLALTYVSTLPRKADKPVRSVPLAKPVAKKPASKPAAKKPAAKKKPAASAKKKPAAKKPAAKKKPAASANKKPAASAKKPKRR